MSGKRDHNKIRVLGISASPRKCGSTDILIDKALDGAISCGAAVDKIMLNGLYFASCQECGGCSKSGICILRDDMTAVYKKVEKSDAIILASPIFFANLTAQAKAFIDRFHCVWVYKNVLKKAPAGTFKKGAFICVSEIEKRSYFENSRSVVKAFFSTIGAEYRSEIYSGGIKNPGDVLKNKQLVNSAFMLGKSLCE